MNQRSDRQTRQISQFPPNQTVQPFFPPSKRCCFTQYKRLLFSLAVIPLQLPLPSSVLSSTPFSFPIVSFSSFISNFFLCFFIFITLLVHLHYYLFYFITSFLFQLPPLPPTFLDFFLCLFIYTTLLVHLHYYLFYIYLLFFNFMIFKTYDFNLN